MIKSRKRLAPDRLSTRYFCHTSKPYDITDTDAGQEMAALTKLHFEQDIEEKLLFQCNSFFLFFFHSYQ